MTCLKNCVKNIIVELHTDVCHARTHLMYGFKIATIIMLCESFEANASDLTRVARGARHVLRKCFQFYISPVIYKSHVISQKHEFSISSSENFPNYIVIISFVSINNYSYTNCIKMVEVL